MGQLATFETEMELTCLTADGETRTRLLSDGYFSDRCRRPLNSLCPDGTSCVDDPETGVISCLPNRTCAINNGGCGPSQFFTVLPSSPALPPFGICTWTLTRWPFLCCLQCSENVTSSDGVTCERKNLCVAFSGYCGAKEDYLCRDNNQNRSPGTPPMRSS